MSDYAVVTGGSLKFKGDDGKKKKKKKSHSSEDRKQREADVAVSEKHDRTERSIKAREDEHEHEHDDKDKDSRAASGSGSPALTGRRMTEAEKRFEAVQRKRREDKAQREAHLTHKDRVNALNKKLDQLSEHHDMPKIGPG